MFNVHAGPRACRAHLNEAPEEPHRRLAAAGLLAVEDLVFEDPFVTLRGGNLWRDYMTQLRAAGADFCLLLLLSAVRRGL